jgi:hypothetical protein
MLTCGLQRNTVAELAEIQTPVVRVPDIVSSPFIRDVPPASLRRASPETALRLPDSDEFLERPIARLLLFPQGRFRDWRRSADDSQGKPEFLGLEIRHSLPVGIGRWFLKALKGDRMLASR